MFTNLSRQEVDAMLGITLQETRVYQEAYEEGQEQGQELKAIAIARRMLQRNIDPSMIAEMTALPLTQIQALSREKPEDFRDF